MRTVRHFVLFWVLVGTWVIPPFHSWHIAHRVCVHEGCHRENPEGGAPSSHDAEHCPICQLAITPYTVETDPAVFATTTMCRDPVFAPRSQDVLSGKYILPFSCGPPV